MVKRDNRLALDTNIVIDILNDNQTIIKRYIDYHQIYLPYVVCGELLFGAINSSKPKQNLKNFRAFINRCTILNSNYPVAEAYANIRKELKEQGKPIPENDIWIAAACIVYEVPLATRDRHFEYIPGLDLAK